MQKIGILTGTTASGKTALALEFARANPEIEIINADSMLVYRGMDIGTAKPTPEEMAIAPHHLIDIRDPDQPFTAGDFYREVHRAIHEIEARGKRALIVGGTGFYLKALLFGLWEAPKTDRALRESLEGLPSAELHSRLAAQDPASATRIGPSDRYRLIRALEIIQLSGKTPSELQAGVGTTPDPRFALWIVDRDSAELSARIKLRADQMLVQGLVAEVERIRAQFPGARALSAVGYAQVCDYLDGNLPPGRKILPGLPGLAAEIELATRQLVKRQRTWFRGQTAGSQAQWFTLEKDRAALLDALAGIYSRT